MSDYFNNLLTEPEGKTLEFKRDLSSPKHLLKTLVAFANTAGGRLVIGVADDQQIWGVEHPLDEEERLCNLIADSIAPRLIPEVKLVTVDEKALLIVQVYLSGTRPHYLQTEGRENGTYVRLGSTNRQADRELIAELQRTADGVAFDELPMPELSITDLDLEEAQKLFSGIRTLDESSLLTLKLLVHDQGRLVPTRGAVLLFGKQRELHFSDAWVQCGRFTGKDKSVIFDHIDIHESLPQSVESILLFLKKHAFRGADFSEYRRKDVWSIPLEIFREGIINALVHADYSQRGGPIRIAFFDDRIEIESPGILLPGITVEDMQDGVSKIRNHVIARVFRELNLIEQWGSGVRRIFSEAKKLGLPKPSIVEIGMRLRLSIPLEKINNVSEQVSEHVSEHVSEQVEFKAPRTTQSPTQSPTQSDTQNISNAVARIIEVIGENEYSAHDLRDLVGLRHRPTFRQNYLHPALKRGVIVQTIPDKPNSRLQKYRLTAKGLSMLAQNKST